MKNSSSRDWGLSRAIDRSKIGHSRVSSNSGGNGNRAVMSPGLLAIAEMLKVVGTPAMQHCKELCQSRGLSEVGF